MLHTARALNGMVVTPHHLASQTGRDVLRDGGTAIEAAVAAGACIAVTYPHMNGLGGDAFWLISTPDGTVTAIDASGRAAQSATIDRYTSAGYDAIPTRGPLAANTAAGVVSGWAAALGQASTHLSLSRLLEPAISYARNGIVVGPGLAEAAQTKDEELRDQPGFADLFRPLNRPLAEGDVFTQSDLAQTLSTLAEDGLESFYHGALSASIANDLAAAGSPISASDLTAHHTLIAPALSTTIAGARLFNHPPPSQGLIALLILKIYDQIKAETADGFDHIHRIVEATKLAMTMARHTGLGEPSQMTRPAQDTLDLPDIAADLSGKIDLSQAAPWAGPGQTGDTVWFAAADRFGTVVSCIQSLYHEFGAGIVLPNAGFVWQNRGSSFGLDPAGWNPLAPGHKPFHTLNPAIAHFDDGRVMAYGAMGGEGQPQSQAAVFTRYAMYGQKLQQAVTAPRWLLGRTWGDPSVSLKLEERFDPPTAKALIDAGHDVEHSPAFSDVMGHAGGLIRNTNGVLEGASDPRSEGGVAAW